MQESERRLIRFASVTDEVITQIKGYDLSNSTTDDKDALMILENKVTQAILPVRAKLMSKLVPLANAARAATGQGIANVGVNQQGVTSLPDLPKQTTRNIYDGHDSDTTSSTYASLDLAHHRKATDGRPCSPSSVLGHGVSSTTTTTTVSPLTTAAHTHESSPVVPAPPATTNSFPFMATTAVKQEGYHDHGQDQGYDQGNYSSLTGRKRRSDADLVALVLELTDGSDDCCELLPSPGLDMGHPSMFPSPMDHGFSHGSHMEDNSLCYMDMFDNTGGNCINPSPLPVAHPLSRPMSCHPSASSSSSSSSSSSMMPGGMMPAASGMSTAPSLTGGIGGGAAYSSSMHHHHHLDSTGGSSGIDLGTGGTGGHGTEYMSSRRRRRLNLIVPNPRKPRTADYTCSLCTSEYQTNVDQNPWWAVYSHECPKCKQSQIPRIDISLGNNAIELDPNVIALYGEGVEDSCDDGEDDDSVGEEDEVGGGAGYGGGGGLEDNEGGHGGDFDPEELKRDVHPFDGEGLLAAEDASKLLVLMCHARSCTGAHASPKHAEICKSTKFLMLHIRDCSGVDVHGRGECQFPWCQPCKRMLRHLTHCYDPANCVVCNPWTLPESFQQLRSLNNRSLAMQQAAAQQQRQAAAAAASSSSQPPLTMGQQPNHHHQQQQPLMMMMMPPSSEVNNINIDNLVMPPEW